MSEDEKEKTFICDDPWIKRGKYSKCDECGDICECKFFEQSGRELCLSCTIKAGKVKDKVWK